VRPTPRVFAIAATSIWLASGCVQRPVNPPLKEHEANAAYEFEHLERNRGKHDDLVVLAFSGGGTRAAAFSYGVLEALRRIEVTASSGEHYRLLDEVDLITGVSGGSFTALTYGLYGEKIFAEYEQRFLKRDVQSEIVKRTLNPLNWGALWSKGWGRSELAANLYDEILFHGATYADLERVGGPAIVVGSTDLASGSRVVFVPQNFDVMCADLGSFRVARAAAASSAVPVVLSPLTINNYGGGCGYQEPAWLALFTKATKPLRPAGRVLNRLHELEELDNGVEDPYLHLVDGAVADNLGLRGVLDSLEMFEALKTTGVATPLDHVQRLIIFVVNSVSTPRTDWNMAENPPGMLSILTKVSGVPVDRYASESVELLKDIDARWTSLREIRDAASFLSDQEWRIAEIKNAPNVDIFTVEVSFAALKDKDERAHLNELPTSFALPAEAVDRLRAAAAKIVLESPDLREALKSEQFHVVEAR
jgi:NTE family protein